MTALSRETAIISNVPSTNANPKIVKMKLYSTNETNSTMGKADKPVKTVKNKVAMGYSITKASTGATTTPMLVSFHLWKISKLKSPRLLTCCDMFSWGEDSMVNIQSKHIMNAFNGKLVMSVSLDSECTCRNGLKPYIYFQVNK